MVRIFGRSACYKGFYSVIWMGLILGISARNGNFRVKGRIVHTKRAQPKASGRISSVAIQGDFPYRYVFPANHPYSTYHHYINPHSGTYPAPNFELFAQNPLPSQAKFELLIKPQAHIQQVNQYPTQASPTNFPYQITPSPVVLLLHPNPPPQTQNNPVQTFLLIPADPSQHLGGNSQRNNQLLNVPGPTASNVQPLQQPIIPINLNGLPQQVINFPSTYLRPPSNQFQSHLSPQALQRAINQLNQFTPSKYISQKKRSSDFTEPNHRYHERDRSITRASDFKFIDKLPKSKNFTVTKP